MKILGIETSCDETAVAIVSDRKEILSHIILSQIDIHKEFGGVVPEVAARNHLDILDKIIQKALKQANLDLREIDAIAATSGPGLIGGVMVGMMTAKTLSSILKKPFIAVNHLEGHALVSRLIENIEFPFLLFLLSGGHCQILLVKGVGRYEKIGETIDDALGEAFDKIGQLLGLSYPGGPKIEKLAKKGDENRFKFPKPLLTKHGKEKSEKTRFNFSFSGLKTAVRRTIEKLAGEEYQFGKTYKKLKKKDVYDICASFQKTVTDILISRFENTAELLKKTKFPNNKRVLVVSGGVAANQYIKSKMENACSERKYDLTVPPIKLCTDNAVMIAWTGVERVKLGWTDELDFVPRARWELSPPLSGGRQQPCDY